MDILASFEDTLTVMQAEQVLTRRQIPFETVPQSRYDRAKCGLGILFSEEYLEQARLAFKETDLKAEFSYPEDTTPQKF